MTVEFYSFTLPEPFNSVHLTNDSSEGDLMASLHQGGTARHQAEKKIYEKYLYLVKLGARQYRLDPEVSASVYSDTIISLINNIVSNRFQSRSSLKSYVHQIFMNKCVDEVRKKTTKKNTVGQRTREIDDLVNILPDNARTVVQQMIERNDQDVLYSLVAELGEKCKKILTLFEDGYEDRDIAEEMNYNSADVVKTTRLRCLEKLRGKYFSKRN